MSTVTLTIDGPTRKLLLAEAGLDASELGDFEGYLIARNRAKVVELRDTATFAIKMFDLLGWEGGDDASDDEREITVERDPFRTWLISFRHNLEAELGQSVVTLAKQERGELDHYWSDDDGQEESVQTTRGHIEREQVAVERIGALMDQMPIIPAGAVA